MAISDNTNYSLKGSQVKKIIQEIKESDVAFKSFPDSVVIDGTTQEFMASILALGEPVGTAFLGTVSLSDLPAGLIQEDVAVYVYSDYVVYCDIKSTDVAPYEWWCSSYNYDGWRPVNTTYTAGTGLELNGTTFSVDSTIATKSEIPSVFQTVFYMNASETGATRHIYKKPDMTDPVTSKDVFDANDKGQVILRISTSATPEMYSDAYLQNAYSANGDYQLLFLDEKTYRSFDTSNLTDSTFTYSSRVIQDKLTAGTNIQINGATISATDTTYSDFTGATSGAAGVHGLVPAPAPGETDKYLKSDGSWATVSQYTLPAASANTLGGVKIGSNLSMDANDVLSATDTTYTAGTNVTISSGNVISATDTTYSNFVGTDGTSAGTAGLVPAPATTDAGKVLSADGSWTGLPDGIKTLTTADYNWPTNNPTSLSLASVPPGIYRITPEDTSINPAYQIYYNGRYGKIGGGGKLLIKISKGSAEKIAIASSVTTNSAVLLNGQDANYQAPLLCVSDIVDNLIGTDTSKVLSATQGKTLNDKIEGRIAQNAGAPTTSTVGTKGKILEDTTNGKLYICTDDTNPYVWEELVPNGATITMTSTDPGEGVALPANNYIAVY